MGTFGDTLRKEREKRGITLENISEGTKIGTRFLRALEAEQFDQLPGGVFNKGFVRAYAKHVGLDEAKTVDDFLAASGHAPPSLPELAPNPMPADDEKAGKRVAEPIRIVETQAEAREQVDIGEILRRLPWRESGTVVFLAVMLFFGWRLIAHRRHAVSNSVAPATAPAPKSTAPASSPATSAKPNPPAPAVASAVELVIHADEDSWLSVTTDGVNQGELMLLAGESKTLQGDREIVVKAGNAGGLAFLLNGAKLPVQGDEGEVVTLEFDRNGVKKIPPQPAPAEQP